VERVPKRGKRERGPSWETKTYRQARKRLKKLRVTDNKFPKGALRGRTVPNNVYDRKGFFDALFGLRLRSFGGCQLLLEDLPQVHIRIRKGLKAGKSKPKAPLHREG